MATEVWFRNPHNYVKELAELGGPLLIAWDRGILVKKHIDALAHAKIYFGENGDFRILLIGAQGTAELDADHDLSNPLAVYPTWEYGEEMDLLEEMMAHPIAEDPEAIIAPIPVDQRPVPGQEHRVVITNPPNATLAANRAFYRHLKELQEDYPECIVHLHGSYSFRVMFGFGLRAADVEPRGDAANGRIIIPAGKIIPYAKAVGCMQWVNLLGFSLVDLKIPRNRTLYNIKSARWAGEHFNEDVKFKSKGAPSSNFDPTSSTTLVPTATNVATRGAFKAEPGDMIQCDTCSLTDDCKYFRDGAVCSLPRSEMSPIAKHFQSRDGSLIVDALGTLLAAQTNRLERGMTEEEEFGELNPEVTKMMNSLFGNGVKLAKLVDPSLSRPAVQINNGAIVQNANPKQMMAAIVREIEMSGVRREDITPEMVEGMLQKMMPPAPPQIVQGRAVVNG